MLLRGVHEETTTEFLYRVHGALPQWWIGMYAARKSFVSSWSEKRRLPHVRQRPFHSPSRGAPTHVVDLRFIVIRSRRTTCKLSKFPIGSSSNRSIIEINDAIFSSRRVPAATQHRSSKLSGNWPKVRETPSQSTLYRLPKYADGVNMWLRRMKRGTSTRRARTVSSSSASTHLIWCSSFVRCTCLTQRKADASC